MSEEKKRGADVTNNPFETNSTSFMKAGLTAAPFAAGLGIGIHRTLQDGFQVPRASSVGDVLVNVRSGTGAPPRPSYLDHLVYIKGAHNKGLFRSGEPGLQSAAQVAWNQAINQVDPLVKKKLGQNIYKINELPQNQIFDAITNFRSQNTSTFADEIFRKFSRNLNVLEQGGLGVYNTLGSDKIGIPSTSYQRMLPKSLQGLAKIDSNLTYQFYSRPGFIEEGYGMFNFKMNLGGFQQDINIPLTQKGAFVEGITQSSKRISPQIGIVNTSGTITKMNREEFFVKELQESILTDINSGKLDTGAKVKSAVNELYQRVFAQEESVPNMRKHERTEALNRYIELRGKSLDLVKSSEYRSKSGMFRPSYVPLSEDELAKIMMAHEDLMPGTSGTAIAKSRVQTADIAKELDMMFPEAIEWSRSPDKAIRQFELSTEAMETLERNVHRPQLKGANPAFNTMYIDPDSHLEFMKAIKMGDGEAVMRRSMGEKLSMEFARSTHLKTFAAETPEDFIAKIQTGTFKPGDLLGWDTSGNPFVMERGQKLTGALENWSKGRGQHVTLNYLDQRRIENHAKWFGDFKALTKMMKDNWFNQGVSRASNGMINSQNIETIVSMDELHKDPYKYSKQVFTGMTQFRPELSGQYETLRKAATIGGTFDPKAFTKEAMKTAVQGGLTPEEFGGVFGAAPKVLGKETAKEMAEEVLTSSPNIDDYIGKMNRGVAVGWADVVYGGHESLRGAGTLGSLEPRGFNIMMKGSAFSEDLGQKLSDELLDRMIEEDPRKLALHEELTKTMQSFTGELKPGLQDQRIFNVESEFKGSNMRKSFEAFIAKGGGYIKPGQGLNNIYVPNAEVISAMRPFRTAGGQDVIGDLTSTYYKMVQSSARMYEDVNPLSIESAHAELKESMQELQYHQAPAGKGMGGFMRGKVKGSRYLTGVSDLPGYKPKSTFQVGLPIQQAEKMFTEMAEMAKTEQEIERISKMSAAFQRGEGVGGLLARHPMIGDYSVAPVEFIRADTPDAQIAIPEQRIRISGPSFAKPQEIQLGPLVGLAGDKDADAYSAFLVSPDSEKQVRDMVRNTDSEFTRRYTQHQVRYQLLKAKAPIGEETLTMREAMVGAQRKLGTTKGAVPGLSVKISEAKRAVSQFGDQSARADAAALLEWLENTPISAKHISSKQAFEGKLTENMMQLSTALEFRDEKALKQVVENITASNEVASSMLRGSVKLDVASVKKINDAMGGNYVSQNLEGFNIDKTVKTIMSSMDDYQSSGEARAYSVSEGRAAKIAAEEAVAASTYARKATTIGDTGKVFGNIAKMAQTATNRMGTLGQSMIKNKKPIGFGLGASLAIGAMMSTPKETIGKPRQPKVSMKAGKYSTRIRPETVVPEKRPIGQPRAPNMIRQQTARVTPGAQTSVKGYTRANQNIAALTNNLTANMTGGTNVNVNLRDNRNSYNYHAQANTM